MYQTYRIISILLWPFLKILASLRLRKGKEIQGRLLERYGRTDKPRPVGKLVWFHAASNGEALSTLPLIHAIQELPSAPTILVTTMTVTAAKIMEQRMPSEGCTHQFISYDHPSWVNRFLSHWTPDMVVWTESELWPNHLQAIKQRQIPAMLVNARLSKKSMVRWSKFGSFFHQIMDVFDVVLAQSPKDLDHFEQLNIDSASYVGNLKDIALPLPHDSIAFDDMRLNIAGRPTLLFASTHKGEEEIAAQCHKNLKDKHPNLLTIIIPRHPNRAEDIMTLVQNQSLNVAMRSLKMSPRRDTDIYLADTLGELGLFYRLCPIVFVGNSMNTKPGGGHNLMEAALLDCAIISGDDLHNFSIMADEMPKSDACKIVSNIDELTNTFSLFLDNPDEQKKYAENAHAYAAQKQAHGIDQIMTSCKPVFQTAQLV
jgi:3-deoxy-D-manno-octulosonic-acid transferase